MMDEEAGDESTPVMRLRELVEQFVAERDWHAFHNPKNLTMSLAIEVGELMEHFQWLTPEESLRVQQDELAKAEVGEELADCLAYVISIANAMQIDLSQTLAKKMKKNAIKYPVPKEGNAND